MSQTADKHYVEQWKATALHQYQAGGFALRNTTTPPEKIIGTKMHFPVFGRVEAEEDVKGACFKALGLGDATRVLLLYGPVSYTHLTLPTSDLV